MSWETQILNEYLVSSILFILLKFLSSLAILDGPELSILFLSQLGSYRRPQLVVDSAFRQVLLCCWRQWAWGCKSGEKRELLLDLSTLLGGCASGHRME